jgi:hypothetical protein
MNEKSSMNTVAGHNQKEAMMDVKKNFRDDWMNDDN